MKQKVLVKAEKSVKKRSASSLESIKAILREKPDNQRMKIGQFFYCDACEQPIYDNNGFIVHGNIYVADPNGRGGLIGDNFPQTKQGEKIEKTDIKESVFCQTCFLTALDITPMKNARSTDVDFYKHLQG